MQLLGVIVGGILIAFSIISVFNLVWNYLFYKFYYLPKLRKLGNYHSLDLSELLNSQSNKEEPDRFH